MAALKPNKPCVYEGQRDEYSVRAWLYQVSQYLSLVQVGNLVPLDEATKISYASTFFAGNAASWWYTITVSNSIPTTWAAFEALVVKEFVPSDSVQRSRDKLRRLYQKTSVAVYLSEFRNIVLTIPEINDGEKLDRFCQGLKPQIKIEVLKAGAKTLEEASRIALNVDSAIFGSRSNSYYRYQREQSPVPMEIGNMEQRNIDRANNACFKCHKPGCRPWKCSNDTRSNKNSRTHSVRTSNMERKVRFSDDNSEN